MCDVSCGGAHVLTILDDADCSNRAEREREFIWNFARFLISPSPSLSTEGIYWREFIAKITHFSAEKGAVKAKIKTNYYIAEGE